jgi:hypothetical protein
VILEEEKEKGTPLERGHTRGALEKRAHQAKRRGALVRRVHQVKRRGTLVKEGTNFKVAGKQRRRVQIPRRAHTSRRDLYAKLERSWLL